MVPFDLNAPPNPDDDYVLERVDERGGIVRGEPEPPAPPVPLVRTRLGPSGRVVGTGAVPMAGGGLRQDGLHLGLRRPWQEGMEGIHIGLRRPRQGGLEAIHLGGSGVMPAFGNLGGPMPSFVIGTAGSEPVAPLHRVGLSRRPQGNATAEAGGSGGSGGNRGRGAGRRGRGAGRRGRGAGRSGRSCAGDEETGGGGSSPAPRVVRPQRPARAASNQRGGSHAVGCANGTQQHVHEGQCDEQDQEGIAISSEQPATRRLGRAPRGSRGGATRKSKGSGTSRTQELPDGVAYAGGFDSNYTFGNFQSSHDAGIFEHMDACPPLPEFPLVPKKIVDLNTINNKVMRTQYDTDERRHIYGMILARNGIGRMKRGVTKEVALLAECPKRVVQRIWEQGREGGSINAVMRMRKIKCGRTKIKLPEDQMEAIPHGQRTTIRCLSAALNMKKSTVHLRLQEKEFRRHTSDLKPALKEENMKSRVLYALQHLEPSSLPLKPTFKAGYNVVHIDEKWFYRTRKNQKFYLTNKEPNPQRQTRNKGHIEKIMFLAAMARPRYNSQGECTFDGKIGVWPYVEWVPAQKESKNRKKGTLELKPCTSVGKEKSREYLIKYVLPAIKDKWPEEDRWNTIFIQQDNAKTHVQVDDLEVLLEAKRGGWDIRMVFQPPNSPDCNGLDLGWFASIQAMFEKHMPKDLPDIVAKVEKSLEDYPHQRLNRIFISHQACMREIIKHKGSIHYALPHLKKQSQEARGTLAIRLEVDTEYVEAAREYLTAPLE